MHLAPDTKILKKTCLYDKHLSLGAKMAAFSGWEMPIYYKGIIQEHEHVRHAAGVFDVSHLGEIQVKGKGAFDFLQNRLTNDLKKLQDGKILYSLLLDEKGFTLDDILIYQRVPDDYYLIVNGSNTENDYQALAKYAPSQVELTDRSDTLACLAVQGPESEKLLHTIFAYNLRELKYYFFKEEKFLKEIIWISRSGYTGEDGFEIFLKPSLAVAFWDQLFHGDKEELLVPAGLGARNTLRLEAGNVLYGHELDAGTTPLEAGLRWAVSFKKGAFVGRDALINQEENGLTRRLVGFEMLDKSIAREHYAIYKGDQRVGTVTSGSFAPALRKNIGLAYVRSGFEKIGTEFAIEIHGRRVGARVVKVPFVEIRHK